MLIRKVFGEDRFWWLSMGLLGVVGALVILLSPMGWGFGSLFAWGGIILRGTSDLTQGLDPRSVFWEDVWYGESSLKDLFLGLFNIARCREASIADNMECSNGIV
jgi:hypothetical protein